MSESVTRPAITIDLANPNDIPLSALTMFFLRCAVAVIPAVILLCFAYFVVALFFGIALHAADNIVRLLSR